MHGNMRVKEASVEEMQEEDSHMVSIPPDVFYLLAHEGN